MKLSHPSRPDEHGFAIILTLIVITMMTVLVIGFNAATRTEQMAARNFSHQEQANQMAMLAVNKAVELLNEMPQSNLVTQPGRYYSPASGPKPLTSARFANGTTTTNINAWQQYSTSSYTNYFIATNTDPAAFTVPLIDVKNGANYIGRYGFWIDDDSSRINLNAAWTNSSDFLPTNARPLVFSTNVVGTNLFSGLTATNLSTAISNFALWVTNTASNNVGYGYFITPRQAAGLWMSTSRSGVNSTFKGYNPMMFQVGAGPLNFRASNSYALSSNGLPAALDAANGFLATYGSSNYSASLSALNTALDGVAGSNFKGPQYLNYFGNSNGFTAKYTNVLRQIIANINDATSDGALSSFTGESAANMLMATNTTGTNLPVPWTVLGLRPALFLNEVALGVAYSTNSPANRVEVQVWMQSELVDPYKTGQGAGYEIRYKVGSLKFKGTFKTNGVQGTFSNPTTSIAWNYDGGSGVTNLGTVASNQFKVPANAFVFEWQVGGAGSVPALPPNASNITITEVTVQPTLAVLRSQSANATTARDWAVLTDFPAGGFTFSNVPSSSQAFGFLGARATAAPVTRFTQSIEKNDPRVRRFGTNTMLPPAGTNAWTFVSTPTLGANNSSVNFSAGTGVPGVGNDLPGSATTIYDHPSFGSNSTNFILGRSNWISAFDLSKIHTGLQWRTLQFRAQDAAESTAGHVPDWALLEAFAVTNTNVAGPAMAYKLNINSLAYPAGSNISAANLVTSGLARHPVVAALLAGMTTTNAINAKIGTNALGFPSAAGFSNATSYRTVATNIASMVFSNSWSSRRNPNTNYQANLYSLPAEVLEVNGVSNFTNNETANEARAQAIYTGVTVASQTFTVYAAGFATDKQGIDTAEVRVRAQVTRATSTGKFKIIFLEPLIWD